MNAKYYRFLFHNTEEGICQTGSVTDSQKQEDFCFLFISGLKVGGAKTSKGRAMLKNEAYSLLVLADLSPWAVKKAVQVLAESSVEKVIMPEYDVTELKELLTSENMKELYSDKDRHFLTNPSAYCESTGVRKVVTVAGKFSMVSNDWKLAFAAFGTGLDISLVMYHGSEHLSKNLNDCVMTVKSFGEEESCSVCVDESNMSCEMRCVLFNDFDVCKKQNGAEVKEYIDGHLLLGTVNLKTYLSEIKKQFQDVWEKIRVIAIPNGGQNAEWNKEILDGDLKGQKQYFVGPAADIDNAQTMKELALAGPRKQFMATTKTHGICFSGFYKHRE